MIWVSSAVVVLGVLSVVVAVHPDPLPGEVTYIRWLQRRGEPVPSIAAFVRHTTSTFANVMVAIVPAALLVRRFGRPALLAALIALVAMAVIQPVYKEIVDRPRPTAQQVDVRAEHSSESFPSGHSLSTTTVWGAAAGFAWRRRRRGLAAAALVPVVATGFASGVQGVHWPSDAIAGTLTGALAAAVALWPLHRRVRAVDVTGRPGTSTAPPWADDGHDLDAPGD